MQIVLISGFTGMEKKNTLFSVANDLVSREKRVALVTIEDAKDNEIPSVTPEPAVMIIEKEDVPCTFITDLLAELPQVENISTFDYLLIELPFSIAPGNAKKYLSALEIKEFSFAPIINVFDMKFLKIDAKFLPKIVSKQIIDSDIIFVNADHHDSEKIKSLENMFNEMNSDARIFMHDSGSEGQKINDFVGLVLIYD